MLKNSFAEPYKIRKRPISDFELEILKADKDYLLKMETPLSDHNIHDLPKQSFPTFIDDVMCHSKINKLLFSSNAKKELEFYNNQKALLLRGNALIYDKQVREFLKNQEKILKKEDIFEKKERQEMFNYIKRNVNVFKKSRDHSMRSLSRKINRFRKVQREVDEKTEKKREQRDNRTRYEHFDKAYNDCLYRSEVYDDFKLPDVSLDLSNVFSRLYQNQLNVKENQSMLEDSKRIILNYSEKKHNKKSSVLYNPTRLTLERMSVPSSARERGKEADKKEKESSKFQRENSKEASKIKSIESSKNDGQKGEKGKSVNIKGINIKNGLGNNKESMNSISYKSSIDNEEQECLHRGKRVPVFKLSNVLKLGGGKEFAVKITDRMKEKCLKKYSGGVTKKTNTYENYLKHLMTLKTPRRQIINCDFVDTNGNSYLQLAVMKQSEKFVKYFLDKKVDINHRNNKGQTALHLAMIVNNLGLISLLINNGADINIRDNSGKNPYDISSNRAKDKLKLGNLVKNDLIN